MPSYFAQPLLPLLGSPLTRLCGSLAVLLPLHCSRPFFFLTVVQTHPPPEQGLA